MYMTLKLCLQTFLSRHHGICCFTLESPGVYFLIGYFNFFCVLFMILSLK